MSLPVSQIVAVTVDVSPPAPVARGFGVGLIVGISTSLPLYDRLRTYSGLLDVAVDFATNTEEYKAAQMYFQQKPAPQTIKIARWFNAAAQAGLLRGGGADPIFGDYLGITTGAFDISIDGVLKHITGLNFSAAGSMAAIATDIQTALNAAAGGTTCVWTGTFFLITSPTLTTGTISYAAPPTTGGVDISATLNLTSVTGARTFAGTAIESITTALNAIEAIDGGFYGLALYNGATAQNTKDAMAWSEVNIVEFFYTSNDANMLDGTATSDLGYFAKSNNYSHTWSQFDDNDPYAAVGVMAERFTTDFTQPNGTSTAKFKQLVGVSSVNLTTTQKLALDGKHINVYTTYGTFDMIAEGWMANGQFQDEVHGLDWLQATVQNAVFTILTQSLKIPLTDAGVVKLIHAAEQAFDQARVNGLLAPGVWLADGVGEVNTGDFLQKGYYVTAGAVADMSPSDRAARKSPPITGIGIGAGAIHSASIVFIFQR